MACTSCSCMRNYFYVYLYDPFCHWTQHRAMHADDLTLGRQATRPSSEDRD